MSATLAAGGSLGPARDPDIANQLSRRRSRRNAVVKGLCVLATLIGLVFLAAILATLLWLGFSGIHLSVFTEMTKPPGSNGGLLNAIVGSLIQTVIGTAIGTPIGMMVGTYLAEYARGSALGNAVRFTDSGSWMLRIRSWSSLRPLVLKSFSIAARMRA